MKYIVNNKEVSRDTFYFCKRAKEENKTFVLLNPNNDVQTNINYHPEYDYFIIDENIFQDLLSNSKHQILFQDLIQKLSSYNKEKVYKILCRIKI